MDFDNSTETITPDIGTVITIGGAGGLVIPKGTTAERPADATALMRYNTETSTLEINSGSGWSSPGGGGGGAPTDASYLVLANNGTLTQDRAISFSNDFEIVDGGANGSYAIKNRRGGEDWTAVTLPQAYAWHSATYGKGRFVAVCLNAANTNAAVSYDGMTWITTTLPASAQWTDVEFGNGVFVAMQTLSGQSVATSTDGVNWTLQSAVMPIVGTWCMTFGQGTFVAAAYNSTQAAISVDGVYWQSITLPSTANWQTAGYGDGTFVLMGSNSTAALTSTDGGRTWVARTTPAANSWRSIAYGNGVFVAVANNSGGTNSATYSTDMGVTWQALTLPAVNAWFNVCYGNGVFIALGNDNTNYAYSADGINWTLGTFPSGSAYHALAYGQGKFITLGKSTTVGLYSLVGTAVGPGKTSNGLIFNDKDTLNTAVAVGIDNDNLWLDETNVTQPPATGVTFFGKKMAGRVMPAFVGPSGMDVAVQPSFWRQKIAWWNPPGNATTIPGVTGMVAPTALGTATTRAVATTNIMTRTRRLGYVSSGTAGNFAGHYVTAAQFTTGNGAGLGGFFYSSRFAFSDAAAVAGARAFVGVTSIVAAPTNVEPSTLTNSIGLAQLSTTNTQLYIVYGGSGAQTAIALGTNFPPMTAAGATNGVVYDLSLFSPPSANGVVYYRVERVGTPFVAEGKLTPTVVGTQTPASTTLLAPRAWRCNNTTASAVAIDILNVYIETDY